LAVARVAPAQDRAARTDAAVEAGIGLGAARVDARQQRGRRRRLALRVEAPALRGAVAAQAAAVQRVDRDLREVGGQRAALALRVAPPAQPVARGPPRTAVIGARAHLDEAAVVGARDHVGGLPLTVVAPADHGAVRAQAAGVAIAGGELQEAPAGL